MRPCKRTSPACGGGGSPDEPDDGKYRRPVFIGALTLGFGLSVALFFSTGAPLPCKVCYPASWLSLVLFALLLSAAGDAAGAVHDFLLQMFLFALAHVAYIRYFLPSAEFSRRPSPPRQSSVPACSCSSSPASSPAWRRPSNGRVSHSTAR